MNTSSAFAPLAAAHTGPSGICMVPRGLSNIQSRWQRCPRRDWWPEDAPGGGEKSVRIEEMTAWVDLSYSWAPMRHSLETRRSKGGVGVFGKYWNPALAEESKAMIMRFKDRWCQIWRWPVHSLEGKTAFLFQQHHLVVNRRNNSWLSNFLFHPLQRLSSHKFFSLDFL